MSKRVESLSELLRRTEFVKSTKIFSVNCKRLNINVCVSFFSSEIQRVELRMYRRTRTSSGKGYKMLQVKAVKQT